MRCHTTILTVLLCLCGCCLSAYGVVNQTLKDEDLRHSAISEHFVQNIGQYTHRGRRFIPFVRPVLISEHLSTADDECGSSSDDFPSFMTDEQLEKGGIVVCFLVSIYCFTLLAIVCDKYFLPSVERICEVLNLSPDVAAATFMSVATSCPELFTNIIATFITNSDLGIGTIVGSSMFNALGVASIGGLAASAPIKLDWWPVTRDVIIYIMAVSLLVVITWDNVIHWYEGLILFVVYFLYFIIMFQNDRISKFVKKCIGSKVNKVDDMSNLKTKEEPPLARVSVLSAYGSYSQEVRKPGYENTEAYKKALEAKEEYEKREASKNPFQIPEGGVFTKFMFFYTWPIKMALRCTIPNPKLHPNWFPISFLMCIVWIGSNSYIVSWMITSIGSVFNIPDAVLGLTFLAGGGSLPESLSIAIMSRRGEGKMGVSNSLGANTMNILFSLGMPWFFKTITMGTNDKAFITIQSGSIEYTILALIVVALILFFVLWLNKFTLSRKSGACLLCVYIVCVVLACLSELVFFPNNSC